MGEVIVLKGELNIFHVFLQKFLLNEFEAHSILEYINSCPPTLVKAIGNDYMHGPN